MRLSTLNQELIGLDVAFARPVTGAPFAALRSMYVTEFNADVARIAVREKDAPGWREEPLLERALNLALIVLQLTGVG